MLIAGSLGRAALGAIAVLIGVSGAGTKGEATTEACFRCNEEFHEGANAWQHFDAYFTVLGELSQGNMHSQNWSNCLNAISVAGHILYGGGGGGNEQDDHDALDAALAADSEEMLVAVLESSRNVEINQERSALQIVDQRTGEVVYHARLDPTRLQRLTTALVSERINGQFAPKVH